jgi:hypothetical protein
MKPEKEDPALATGAAVAQDPEITLYDVPASRRLPEALRPVTREELRQAAAESFKTKRCHCCSRDLWVDICYAPMKCGRRHSYCYSCRHRRLELNPSTQRKRRYVERAKARGCADCARCFPPAAMILVQTSPTVKINVSSGWKWHSEDQVTEALKTCVPVCCVCKRLREMRARKCRREEARILANRGSAETIPTPPPAADTVNVPLPH